MTVQRRSLIAGGMTLLAAPRVTLAQTPEKVWRIGFLGTVTPSAFAPQVEAFRAGLLDLGYVEGKNMVIEYRWAEGSYARLPGLAAELVRSNVDILMTMSSPGAAAAQRATTTIPIVMSGVGDPVGFGFVKSLAHPGGNMTGLSNQSAEFVGKQLELLLAVTTKGTRVSVLGNPDNSSHATALKNIQAAAQRAGATIHALDARTPQEIEKAFLMMVQHIDGGVIVLPEGLFIQQRSQIAELAVKARLPSIMAAREQVEAGGLMSFGVNNPAQFRRAAAFIDKILKGAKPANLPVEQPTKFDLVINLKTAKALGITIPQSVLLRADEVIQ